MTGDHYAISADPGTIGPDGLTTARIRLAGDFDLSTSEDLREMLVDIAENTTSDRIIVDLSQVRFIDSEAISGLLEGYLAAEQAGITFRLFNPTGVVARVIGIIGIQHLVSATDYSG